MLKISAFVAGAASLYALFAMFTQGMLGGVGDDEIWWDRVYAWWVGFLAAGFLLMLAIYLWRKSQRLERSAVTEQNRRAVWRVVLFPLGHVLLTGCLYFADFASYLRDQGTGGLTPAMYFIVAAGLVLGAAVAFWYAHKLRRSNAVAG